VNSEEAMHRQRQRVLQLGRDAQARAGDDVARGVSVEPLQVADLDGVLALARPTCRDIGLQRDLDHDGSAGPCDLGQQRGRVGHVLEHVGEDAELVRAVGVRQVRAVVALDRVDLHPLARDRHCGVGDLDAREPAAEAARVQLT